MSKNNRYREEEISEGKNVDDSNVESEITDNVIEDDIDKLKEEIKFLKNEVLKSKAEEINFKKRIDEEKKLAIKYGNQALLEDFVEQLDLFDSVVQMKTDDPVLKNFLIGFEMINNNFKQILTDQGVKKIDVKVGDMMDPKYHHALQVEWDKNYEENVILKELKAGYLYKDRILRPTLVKVNKKEENKNE